MEHADEIEQPGIGAAIKNKAEEAIDKICEVVHNITGAGHREGQVNKKEPPIGAHDQDAAEY